jgi:CHAT domain-containing protein
MVSMLVEQHNPEAALRYAERAKGRILLDVLRNGRISITKSSNQAEQADEHRLYSEIVSLNTQIRAERMRQQPHEASLSDLETRLQKARSAYEVFQAALYAANPELKAQRGVFSEFTLEDASAAIRDSGTAVLEYVVTSEQAFLFMLTKESASQAKVRLHVRSINIKKSDLSDLVEKYRSLLSTNHPGFRQSGRELYDLLVKPAESYLAGKTTVCIVPDGPLWSLPFQALPSDRDRYMLESHAIYYAPSLQVLLEMRKRSNSLQSPPASNDAHRLRSLSSEAWAGQLYAVGNPALGGEAVGRAQALRNAPFVPLPETEQEVHALAYEVYGLEASTVRVGTAAREDTVKAEIGKYRVVHLASHGIVDDLNPLYSYIVLAPSSDLREDGLLEAWELMEMNLEAELVVLSACDMARGRVGDGEGMIGMTWALFVAGVPTTVASQWQVPSQSTTKLMVAFHKNLQAQGSAKKMSKAEAWREAALGMMADPRYRMKPYYWAGFVVLGDGGY